MRIAILGTRGIPNTYGGFEQFAEYLSVGFVKLGHSVTVYNVSFHEYREDNYKGVKIRKVYSPEKIIGAAGNFIYDFLSLKDALKRDFDIIYELGYHSNAPSYYLLKKQSPVVVTNMDGIEWKRSKWNAFTQKLIRKLEYIAVKKSDYLISDNPAIHEYYIKQFNRDSYYIPYGAKMVDDFDEIVLKRYHVSPRSYFLIIARLEPENNIETILDGFVQSGSDYPFLVIGNKDSRYGKFLQNKYKQQNIRFLGGIYQKKELDDLRHFACRYFHGHSVGGTNPSLLEAMAAQAFIIAHDNPYNRVVLEEGALYFKDSSMVSEIIQSSLNPDIRNALIISNVEKIRRQYSWDKIISDYERLFQKLLKKKSP